MELKDPSLLKNKAYINGHWVGSNQEFSVTNPFDRNHIASVPDMKEEEAVEAVNAAHSAFESWRKNSAYERSKLLKCWYDLQIEHQEDLALILTMEQGKPLAEARGEVAYGASFVEWFAEEAKRTYGEVIPGNSTNQRMMTLRQPVGVVAAITPWNFPNAMITRKVAPALAAGCTVVLKPAEYTPLSALALAELADRAGIPPGVFNVVTTNSPEKVGAILTSSSKVRKFSFTGSTVVGKQLLAQCANTVKRVSMELGGNAPFIVFDDADLDAAVEGAVSSKYRNAGQTCVCANRFYVQEDVYDRFVEKLSEAVSKLKCGNGLEPQVDIGPLIDNEALDFIEVLVADATQKGAHIVTGGKRGKPNQQFFDPTVLTHVNESMKLHSEEIFGPLAPVFRFSSEEEVIEMANNTPYGLAAYFYSKDNARIWRVSEALEYGIVGVNTGLISTASAPFGGVKESGLGREGARQGIDEFLEVKYINQGNLS